MGATEGKNEHIRNMERTRFLLGKAKKTRKILTLTITYCFFLFFFLSGLLFIQNEFLSNWMGIIVILFLAVSYIIVSFFMYRRIKRVGLSYAQYMVEVRSNIDSLVEMKDWTVYRRRNFGEKNTGRLMDIIASFDNERKSFMSPVRQGINYYIIMIILLYLLSISLFLLVIAKCVFSIIERPCLL